MLISLADFNKGGFFRWQEARKMLTDGFANLTRALPNASASSIAVGMLVCKGEMAFLMFHTFSVTGGFQRVKRVRNAPGFARFHVGYA